jgi:hypothetical protein
MELLLRSPLYCSCRLLGYFTFTRNLLLLLLLLLGYFNIHTCVRLGDCCKRLGDNNDAWDKFTLCLKSARDAGQSGTGFVRKCKQRLRSLAATGHAAPPAPSLPPSEPELSRRARQGKSKQKGKLLVKHAASSGSDVTAASGSTGGASASEDGGEGSGSSSSSVDSASAAAQRQRKAAIPCRNWSNFGSCQHGSGCHFSHQLAASAAPAPPSDAPRAPCRNWASGNCKFGRLCHFSHEAGTKK